MTPAPWSQMSREAAPLPPPGETDPSVSEDPRQDGIPEDGFAADSLSPDAAYINGIYEDLETCPQYQKFAADIGDPLARWAAENVPAGDSVFYPFGGPDLLHPLFIFPHARRFLLVGLERIGDGNPRSWTREKALKPLEEFLKKGFFVTNDMNKEINWSGGVTPLLCAQIRMAGGYILDVATDAARAEATVVFRLRGERRSVTYRRYNLLRDFKAFKHRVENEGFKDACLLKASSYCLHQKNFEKVRDFILGNFACIVQDDTGVPLRVLKGRRWQVSLSGYYSRPYGREFAPYFQKDLRALFAGKSIGDKLPFCFGYGCRDPQAGSVIMVCRKQA